MTRKKIKLISHRGLDLDHKGNTFPESSVEAFKYCIKQGFSIEFDACFLNNNIVVWHEATLERLKTNSQAPSKDFPKLATLQSVLELIEHSALAAHALHLKGRLQNKTQIDALLFELKKYPLACKKLFVFDLKQETAAYIKRIMPEIALGASVSHAYDIRRFGSCVWGTLMPVEQVKQLRHLFEWVWLDEWDLKGENNKSKKLYSVALVKDLRALGFKVALVSPELHATSPGITTRENHPDACNKNRFSELIKLMPDAICTDYPTHLSALAKGIY